MIPFPSGIRLAVLASRKEVIDFEKWLSSNLNTYKDVFFEVVLSPPQAYMITKANLVIRMFGLTCMVHFQECLKFLKEIQFGGSPEFSAKPFHHTTAVLNFYLEASSTFFEVLSLLVGYSCDPLLICFYLDTNC